MENSSEYYYEKLKSDPNPGAVLAALYCSLYDKPVTRSEIIMCNRLIKAFGRFTAFHSIIDMAGSYPEHPDTPYPLLYTICKRRFENAHTDSILQSRQSLNGYIAEIEKEVERLKKLKIKTPTSKGLEKDGGE